MTYNYTRSKKKTNWLGVVLAIAIIVGMIVAFFVVLVLPFFRAYEEAKTIGPGPYGTALSMVVLAILILVMIGFLSGLL